MPPPGPKSSSVVDAKRVSVAVSVSNGAPRGAWLQMGLGAICGAHIMCVFCTFSVYFSCFFCTKLYIFRTCCAYSARILQVFRIFTAAYFTNSCVLLVLLFRSPPTWPVAPKDGSSPSTSSHSPTSYNGWYRMAEGLFLILLVRGPPPFLGMSTQFSECLEKWATIEGCQNHPPPPQSRPPCQNTAISVCIFLLLWEQ